MNEMKLPGDSRGFDVTIIPVGEVQTGMSLAVEETPGQPQLFQVEKVAFSSRQQDDGTYLTRYMLTSEPAADGGAPWVIDFPPNAMVCRILGYTKQGS